MNDDPKYKLNDIPGFLINMTARLMRNRFDQALAPFTITSHQFAVLMLCYHGEAETPKGIADSLRIENAAVTGLLDRMEKKGWLERKHNDSDRRSVNVLLSEEGKKLAEKVVDVPLMTGKKAFKGVTEVEKRLVLSTLAKVRRNLT